MSILMALPLRRIPQSSASRSIRFSSSSSSASAVPKVIGSAPTYSRHLVIHTTHPSATWPSHLESVSPLYKELGKRWSQDERFKTVGFGFSEGGPTPAEDQDSLERWDSTRSKFEAPTSGTEEIYSATLYPDFLHFPDFSLSSLPSLEETFASLPAAPSSSAATSTAPATTNLESKTHIYVCTHGSRDCKCGDLGEKLYGSILSELKRRKLGGELATATTGAEEETTPHPARTEGQGRVQISRIAHIGGHKFAANALVYKERDGKCDWYGLLNESDVNDLIDDATSQNSSADTTLYSRWRGRLGLSAEETQALYRSSSSPADLKKGGQTAQELGERVEVRFVTYDGEELDLVGYEGESLMQVAKRGDAPSILATCGGNCECATCHVHIRPLVPPSSATTDATTRRPTSVPELPATLPEMTDEEDEQLDFAIGADDDSRLACQIPVTRELGDWIKRGGRIHLPRY